MINQFAKVLGQAIVTVIAFKIATSVVESGTKALAESGVAESVKNKALSVKKKAVG